MPYHSRVIIQDVSPEIIDAPLTLITITGPAACGLPFSTISQPILHCWMDATMQPGDCWIDMSMNYWHSIDAHLRAYLRYILTVIGCSTIVQIMHTASIDSQCTVSMYYHLNSKSSRHLSFWVTTIHVINMIHDVIPERFNTFGWQYTA